MAGPAASADTKQRLLDAASALVQTRGYNGFSFHDLAAEVGIRTASIHYHYPTKADLVVALTVRYADRFLAALGPADAAPPDEQLRRYVAAFRSTLEQGRMCLCGMIGAEVESLPDTVRAEVSRFWLSNEAWLGDVLSRSGLPPATARRRSHVLLATLEGAMILSRTRGGLDAFDAASREIIPLLLDTQRPAVSAD
jgi:TetR/AcrR family transcriptional regulator, transcriptional repressor for nem operon